jgi:hypothetical protein
LASIALSTHESGGLPESSSPDAGARHAAWSPLRRFGFRVAFLYGLCFLFLYGNGNLITLIPVAGDKIDFALSWPVRRLDEWIGQHVFHLTGVAARWHATGSGDTAMNWVSQGLFVALSLAGGVLWTIAATAGKSSRTEYQTLFAWLRFLLRLTCAGFMFEYGLSKLFPIQMAPISVGILNEQVGQMSPMTMLWALIGMNPLYEVVCGLAEVAGGILFLFRRTALLGALLSAFVMVNVVLYNFFFDVPVKLFAVNLLAACLFVALPDMQALFRFFWLHQPAAPSGVWVPPASRRGFRMATRALECVFIGYFVLYMPYRYKGLWDVRYASSKVQSPLLGAWKLDTAHPAGGAFVTPEGLPATDLYVDTVSRAFLRSTDRALWRTRLKLDAAGHKLQITCYMKEPVDYIWYMPDSDHLLLKSKTDWASLTRVPVAGHYPLLERGFHFVNEWGLER